MKLACGNCGSGAVVRHDPDGTGFLAMCDVCGWRANKVAAELDRAQKDEIKRRQQLAAGKPPELEPEPEEEPVHTARRR